MRSKVGTPQGSVLSPQLANIVLDKLDKFIQSKHDELHIGKSRKKNPIYIKYENERKYYKLRDPARARKALIEKRKIPKFDMFDPNFKRYLYVRYADDFILLITNTYKAAVKLKNEIAKFLKEECGLELNIEKTTITNTRR